MFLCRFFLISTLLSISPLGVEEARKLSGDEAACKENLEKIYAAIQEYRKENKKLPGYFHDLVPKYAEKKLFLCPVGEKEGEENPFPDLGDPELKSHYLYEFSARPTGSMWQGGSVTMAEWKGMQMSLLGGVVPLIRCWMHDPVFNISFDGDFFESPGSWEEMHVEKINYEDLAPENLRARLLQSAGKVERDTAAFEEIKASIGQNRGGAEDFMAGAEKLEAFLKEFPESRHVDEARQQRMILLFTALRTGDDAAEKKFDEMMEQVMADPSSSEDEKFQLKAMALHGRTSGTGEEFEKGLRALMKDFPGRIEPYFMLLSVGDREPERSKEIAEEIVASQAAPEAAKAQAKGKLKLMGLKGKPLEMTFTALDGKEVDLAQMKGKVVLVDFWATWCGPCVAELPNVKAAYDRLNPKGFEIVGISFDNNKGALENFVKSHEMEWPQYFDGKGWQNKFGQEYGINSIPAMWLIAKDGTVADLNAREDLVGKVERLLSE